MASEDSPPGPHLLSLDKAAPVLSTTPTLCYLPLSFCPPLSHSNSLTALP